MSQFGNTAKNPPWARPTQSAMPTTPQQQLQPQMMGQTTMNPAVMVQYQQQQLQNVYQQMQPMQQSGMPMGGMGGMAPGMGQGIYPQVATVSYPTPRALNPTAFQTQQQHVATPVPPTGAAPSPKQRVFTGSVTKVHDNFGFVDEDVFFQTSCCVKGSNPQVGDRVLVEASYNPSMPFKWNATRIQVLPMSGGGGGSARNQQSLKSTGYNAVPPPSENAGGGFGGNRGQKRQRGGRGKDDRGGSRDDNDEAERKKRRDERQREREEKEKATPASGSVARRRSKSPARVPRRRPRVVPRYMVQIPKIALDLPEADVLELRRRYANMYIPSDFFSTNFRWVDAFPPHNPFALDRPCSFHVMHKEVDQPGADEEPAVLEPADADYLYSAKVMLISMPSMAEIYRKCCSLSEDATSSSSSSDDAPRDFVHPTRLVNFLVGLRGKNETMAVGGPWSPSLDGADPVADPSVLIKTAIRSCKALTGIDLSHCTQWYRFLELYYRRAETTSKGRAIPARVETVVLFLPDVWSCVPTRLDYDATLSAYRDAHLDKRRANGDGGEDVAAKGEDADDKDKDDSLSEIKKEPTHFSELDPKVMKVSELRTELEARTMSPKGLKSQLVARLAKAIKTEADKAEEDEGKEAEEPEVVAKPEVEEKEEEKSKKEEEDKKKHDERERLTREKRYTLPEAPHIIVHPSRTAKGGKFDCTVMSLSLLLDYRPEDTKEHSFEVSLFAELFNEMLMRDYGFRIYRALHDAPEPVKEEKKEKERDKKDDKDKDKKDDKDKDKKDDKEKKDDKDKDKKDDKEKDKRDERKTEKKDEKSSRDAKRDEKRAEEKEKEKEKEDEDEEDEEDEEDDDSKSSRSKDNKESSSSKDPADRDRRQREKDRKKKERPKLYTADPNLLLSFVYFDQSHCGYIFDKDIEELLYTLGLNLSRAQVRKLVQKCVVRDSLHYRKLTDKPVEVAKVVEVAKDDEGKEVAKKVEEVEEVEPAAKNGPEESEALMNLAYGNKRLLPVFNVAGPTSKRARKAAVDGEEAAPLPEGFVMYKGGLLDVAKLTSALRRSEKARTDTEALMVATKESLEAVRAESNAAAANVRDLSAEVKEFKAKLAVTKDQLANVKASAEHYLTTLKEVHDKVTPVIAATVVKVEPDAPTTNHEPPVTTSTRWSEPTPVAAEPVKVKVEAGEDEPMPEAAVV